MPEKTYFYHLKRAVLGLALALSLFRFGWEVNLIGKHCCFDFEFFWDAVRNFAGGGHLYVRDLNAYTPGAAIYKFPPFFAAPLLVFARLGIDQAILTVNLWLQVGMYMATMVLLQLSLMASLLGWASIPLWIVALNHGPFFETLIGLQAETPILFLLTIAAVLFQRKRDGMAGAALGLAAALKLYPVLMLAYLIAARRWRAVTGFAAGIAVALIIGLLCFGINENLEYFFRILPHMAGEPIVGFRSENLSIASYLTPLQNGHWVVM